MARFLAVLDGEVGAFGVSFPDCPGCTAMGKSRKKAYARAVGALTEWVEDARAAGKSPKPSRIEDLQRDPDVIATLAEGGVFIEVPLVGEIAG